MPFVEVKLIGSLTREQKAKLAKRITDALKEVAGKPPQYTNVVFQELPAESWAAAGELFG